MKFSIRLNNPYVVVCLIVVVAIIVGLVIYFYSKPSQSPKPTSSPTSTNHNLTTLSPSPIPTTTSPVPTPRNIDITNTGWYAWSTTTQFGSGDSDWPSGSSPSLNLPKIMSWGNQGSKPLGNITYPIGNGKSETVPVYGTMGVAMPWSIILSLYKTRTDFINDVTDSCAGRNSNSCCYIIQPIQTFPTEVKNNGDNHNTDVSGGKGADLNGDNIAAKYGDPSNPISYPAYFCIPYEGCGGDCSKAYSDCFNSCKEISNVVTVPNYFSTIDTTKLDPSCNSTLSIWGSPINNFSYYSDLDNILLKSGNDPVAISNVTANGSNIAGVIQSTPTNHVNYCSGKNMHFDVAQNSPLWQMFINNPVSGKVVNMSMSTKNTTDITNTMVRFIRVPGNIFGNFDIQTPQCGANSWSAGKGGVCPPNTSGYQVSDITCCCSGPTSNCSVLPSGNGCDCKW